MIRRLALTVAALVLLSWAPEVVAQPHQGADFSANAAGVPMTGGWVLLTTVPATLYRDSVEVQNQSASIVQVVRDNGSGGAISTVLLSSGGSAGTQGGSWSSTTFKGRVRVYGPAGSQVAAYQE